MAEGAVNFFLDALDDPLLPDAIPAFDGGQFSNVRANLLKENQSKELIDCDIDSLGKLRTRRGTIKVGTGPHPPSGVVGTIIQGLTSFQTKDYNYVVAANNRRLWQFNGSTWDQIGLGGTADDEEILIARKGRINNSSGYTLADTVLTVDGIVGIVNTGETLRFTNNMRTDPYEYVIADHSETAGNTTQITLEEPGLVFDIKDNWNFVVLRPATVNHPTHDRYAAGATGIDIDGYTGEVNDGEIFVIKSENINHTISAHTPVGSSPTTHLTFNPPLGNDWLAADAEVPIVFAQGNDQLFFCDGVGPICGWNGQTLMKIGSYSMLDQIGGTAHGRTRTTPPTGCKILLWFQNRLIASGVATEPDGIYFSDFFDASAWDRDYQLVRIGGGESDPITGLLAWTDFLMLVFKKNSIYAINLDPSQNPNPNDPTLLVASFGVKQLHKRIGCPAPNTAVQVGGGSTTPGSDVFFVDDNKKVHSIRRVMAAETQQEVGQAVSLPIQDVVDRINRDYIDRCTAMYHNEHYILGIPSSDDDVDTTRPNKVVAYNLLTQSWCGMWTWKPTCFSIRTDLGSYSKLIFGDVHGNVVQWMDDLSLDEETTGTYEDMGSLIRSAILTRAITFGDGYSYKTGLNVELEFDESEAEEITIKVLLDKVQQRELLAPAFSSASRKLLKLPFTIPIVLPLAPGLLRKAFDLQRYGPWRELQFRISTSGAKLGIRSIRVTGFMDSIKLQT